MDIKLITWLKDGQYRIKTLELLQNSPLLSSELASALDINRASMSRILRVLKEKGLVKQVSAKSRTVSYCLPDKGIKALKQFQDSR